MIIDFHTHIFPNSLASRAISSLSERSGIVPAGEGTASDLLTKMTQANIHICVVHNVATNPAQVTKINDLAISNSNPHFILTGAMHPQFENKTSELKRLAKHNIKGIKMHAEFQSFHPSDEFFFPMYETLEQEDLFILFHAGAETMVNSPKLFSHPREFLIIRKNFPKLKIILAHLGGHLMLEEAKSLIWGEDFFLDLSYELEPSNLNLLSDLLNSHPHDKILFGSDYPWRAPADYLKLVSSGGMPILAQDAIFSKNAQKLLKL